MAMRGTDAPSRVDVARTFTLGRHWQSLVRGCLLQAGIGWMDAQSLIEDRSVGGMPVADYLAAGRCIRQWEALRDRLRRRWRRLPAPEVELDPDPFASAAARVAAGGYVFDEVVWLAEQLVERGEPPVMLPNYEDGDFWRAVDAAPRDGGRMLADYLRGLPNGVPEVARESPLWGQG